MEILLWKEGRAPTAGAQDANAIVEGLLRRLIFEAPRPDVYPVTKLAESLGKLEHVDHLPTCVCRPKWRLRRDVPMSRNQREPWHFESES